jgi:ankyrin repeat protein
MLIERGADVSAQDKDGRTPLHLAFQRGQLGIARTLVDRGAGVPDPDQDNDERTPDQDNDGRTPMHLALMVFIPIVAIVYFHISDLFLSA